MPDAQRPTSEEAQALLEEAQRLGLVRFEIPLVILGWDRFELWMTGATLTKSLSRREIEVQAVELYAMT